MRYIVAPRLYLEGRHIYLRGEVGGKSSGGTSRTGAGFPQPGGRPGREAEGRRRLWTTAGGRVGAGGTPDQIYVMGVVRRRSRSPAP